MLKIKLQDYITAIKIICRLIYCFLSPLYGGAGENKKGYPKLGILFVWQITVILIQLHPFEIMGAHRI